MAIKKCDKCELNYVKDEEKHCKVCQKLLDNKKPTVQKAELCPSCSERLVAKGYELCNICLADMLDTVEKLEDENGDIIDQDITPADMEVTVINVDDDDGIIIDDSEDEIIPEEIKNEIDKEELELAEEYEEL